MKPSATDPLSRYLSRRHESIRAFALRCRLRPSTISRYIRGERNPTLEAATAIQVATDGAVPVSYWLGNRKRAA